MTTEQVRFNDHRFRPHNSPPDFHPSVSSDGHQVAFRTVGGTDWWRLPEESRDTGVMFGFNRVMIPQGIEVGCEVDLDVTIQYDQATIMLRAGDTWVKAGLEYDNDKLYAGCVIANYYSDWSIQPAEHTISKRFTIALKDRMLKVYLGDEMIREVVAFGDGKSEEVWVGVMGCSPKGTGTEVRFKDFTIKEGVRW
ncbi:hypothetical protein BCR39DRAFT_537598 [Naematelia encephala]|uniref:Concanavalin A-like lectin/glucanase domain-containing protein n=1 Tax=Naematelia encephala TaxID=71784 RepID=A0A1Y2AYT2_9TREE|nr:hypothetical protein BCR39DRAFT_537598 [Naematelia encephala]